MAAQYGIIDPVPITSTQPVMRSITPTALPAGQTDDWAPEDATTGLAFYEAQRIRVATHASGSTLTGLDATHVPDGLYQVIDNLGPGVLTLVDESGSLDENQIALPATTYTVGVDCSVMIVYDGTRDRWTFVDQGASSSSVSGTGGIIVNYTATGTEGTSFMVPIGQTLSSANYTITMATEGVSNVPFADFPQGVGDRTTTQFRCNTVADLTAGDKLVFVLFMES